MMLLTLRTPPRKKSDKGNESVRDLYYIYPQNNYTPDMANLS